MRFFLYFESSGPKLLQICARRASPFWDWGSGNKNRLFGCPIPTPASNLSRFFRELFRDSHGSFEDSKLLLRSSKLAIACNNVEFLKSVG